MEVMELMMDLTRLDSEVQCLKQGLCIAPIRLYERSHSETNIYIVKYPSPPRHLKILSATEFGNFPNPSFCSVCTDRKSTPRRAG